jgi:hypothetical protein
MTSFYDLDYIIELNEKRLEQYSNAYQKNMDKFTNILVIYSAFAIFLIPIIQSLFFAEINCYLLHHISFYGFITFFIFSLVNTIRFLIPVEVAYLIEPKTYYETFRLSYEAEGRKQAEVDKLIKASYIDELEEAVSVNNKIFKRKGLFYYRAFNLCIYACIPYLFCLGFQIALKDDKVQKVEIINNLSTFNKNQHMPKDTNKTTTTRLPGVDNSQVKPSSPQLIKETFQTNSNKEKKTTTR